MTATTETIQKLSRKERGTLLAQNHQNQIQRTTEGFQVPSQTSEEQYTVKIGKEWECTCPDHKHRDTRCKHIWAVELTVTRSVDQQGNVVEKREIRTNDQNWTAYNAAQTNEQKLFMQLLGDLTDTIQTQEQTGRGRPSKQLNDMAFLSAMKVYTGFSLRRFESLMDLAEHRGHIDETCGYNTISRYMNKEKLTPILHNLIEKTAAPLTTVETDFAVDSSGFSTSTFGKFAEYKHEEDKEVRKWVKTHIICGTKTNIVTGVELNMNHEDADPTKFPALLQKTANQFNVEQISADKAYSTKKIHRLAENLGAEAYIPFKDGTGTNGKRIGKSAWKKMYHKFQYKSHEFYPEYKKRNNVETTFHMIKSKFGEDVNNKKETAQFNEVLLKILCHNIAVLIQEIHELGIEPEF